MTFRNFLCVFFIVLVQAFFCVGAVWADPATPPAPSLWAAFQHVIFLSLLVFFVFYLMVLRPQATKLQQHAKLIESLKKGDQVTTAGGLIGAGRVG
jgi:preprotein translocase subunit YajC